MPQFLPIRLTHCWNSLAWSSWQLSYTHTHTYPPHAQTRSQTQVLSLSRTHTCTHILQHFSSLKDFPFSTCIKHPLILPHNRLSFLFCCRLFLFNLFLHFLFRLHFHRLSFPFAVCCPVSSPATFSLTGFPQCMHSCHLDVAISGLLLRPRSQPKSKGCPAKLLIHAFKFKPAITDFLVTWGPQ